MGQASGRERERVGECVCVREVRVGGGGGWLAHQSVAAGGGGAVRRWGWLCRGFGRRGREEGEVEDVGVGLVGWGGGWWGAGWLLIGVGEYGGGGGSSGGRVQRWWVEWCVLSGDGGRGRGMVW